MGTTGRDERGRDERTTFTIKEVVEKIRDGQYLSA
jgi:hypothetical protein